MEKKEHKFTKVKKDKMFQIGFPIISAAVVVGIAIISSNSILFSSKSQIKGLTTAAGLWSTATVGLALGAGFYEGALIAFLVSAFTVMVLNKIERKINDHLASFGLYLEIKGDANICACLDYMKTKYHAHDLQVTVPRSGVSGNVGIEASVDVNKKENVNIKSVIKDLDSIDYVVYAIESV